MPRWLRITLGALVLLPLAGAVLFRWLTQSEPVPETTSYRIDLPELQRQGDGRRQGMQRLRRQRKSHRRCWRRIIETAAA